MQALLPATVRVVATRAPGDAGRLLPCEAAMLGRAAPKRLAEFAAGRECARRALSAIAAPAGPLLIGEDREPLWPPGVAGSITHCTGYCAAAVGRSADVHSVGIDAEVHDALPEGVLERVALPEEQRFLRARSGDDRCWDRILFSAKESVFKAWFPLTKRWLDFADARIEFAPEAGTFVAKLLVAGPLVDGVRLDGFHGRFHAGAGLVLTAIAVRASTLHAADRAI